MTSKNRNNTSLECDSWVHDDNEDAPVALHLRQMLVPVEGQGAPIFPATYASASGNDSGYNIDKLEDGTKVASIDSVGSQANRIEPIFSQVPYRNLVPQIEITYEGDKFISILEAHHRLGDAVIRSTDLKERAQAAFKSLLDEGDVTKLAKLAPTSLVFGVWDSRDTQAKLPRLVQSVIRAFGVSKLTRSAQYFPSLSYDELGVFSEEERKEKEGDLARRGYVPVPAVGKHGGIIAEEIRRDVTLNLIALRRLRGENVDALRTYILGLALVSTTAPFDGFLRSGCLLVLDSACKDKEVCELVYRDGTRKKITLSHQDALSYAKEKAELFGVEKKAPPVEFDKGRAKKDVEEAKENKSKKGKGKKK